MEILLSRLIRSILNLFLFCAVFAGGDALAQQNVIVHLVNFQDDQRQPFSLDAVQTSMQTVGAFYQEVSFGQVVFNTEVRDWRTLPINATCDVDAISAAAGIEQGYDKIIFAFPKNLNCSYSGRGFPSGLVYINSTSFSTFVVAHELGHTYGLTHSSTVTSEYGNVFDVMGVSKTYHMNAFQKERAGWLTVPQVQSGTYRIPSYQAIKIFKGNDGTFGAAGYYYLEFRYPFGFDANLAQYGIQNGVLIHKVYPSLGQNDLLDITPATATYFDSYLTGTFTDGDITIVLLSVDSTGADVQITVPSPVCVKFNPKGKCLRYV